MCVWNTAQAQQGTSCQNPITLTNDYNAPINGAGTVWYVANTFDLPLTVRFFPTNNSDPKPDIEMDFSCTPGVYNDTILCSFFCSSNSVYISMPYNPENDIRQKTDEQGHVYYEVAMGEYYRNLLLSAGISYNVQVFVKVTYHSSGQITLSPDAEFAGCMDTDDWLLFGNWLNVAANDQETYFVAPYASWKKDSVRFIWDGPADATVAMGSSCSFEALNPLDDRRIDVWTMNGGGDTTNHRNSDILHYLEYNASGDMYFIKVVSAQPGRLKVERMPLAKPDGNATLLEYDQPVTVNANDVDALYAIPMTWTNATMFTTPTPNVFKMYVGTTATFTPQTAIATYQFDKTETGHQLGLFADDMAALWTRTKKKYLYIRFETAAGTTITPSLWTPSDCMNKIIRLKAGQSYSVKARSASYYGLYYSEWVGGDLTLSWEGTSKCPVYFGDTCANMNNATNVHVIQDESIPRGGSYTIPASEIAEWAEYVDADGFIYVRFNPQYGGTVTLTTTAPEEVDGCISEIEQTTVTAWDSYEWRGTIYQQTGVYDIPNNNEECPDTIYRLNLTIHTTSQDSYSEIGCDSIWYNGKKYTESGVYIDTVYDVAGNRTVMILNFTVNYATTGEETQEACGSYEWHGQSYFQSGDYPFHLTNAVGCDSTAILHLTVYTPHVNTDTTATVWDSIAWYGQKYTASGEYPITKTDEHGCDYTHTLLLTVHTTTLDSYEETGCDSIWYNAKKYTESGVYQDTTYDTNGNRTITTLNFTVRYSTSGEETQEACDSYEWNGKTYTTSGDYTFKTTNGAGCDSTATLHLTVKKSTSSEDTKTVCDSYEWNGKTYTESGDYMFNTTNVAGCDSTATLHLTVNKSTSSEETQEACVSYEWNGKTYTESGDYVIKMMNVAGCDSTATLHLTIKQPTTGEETKEVCNEYEWHEQIYTKSGDYTFKTTNAAGCDSTATLHLTIKECLMTYDTVYFCAGQNTEHEELLEEAHVRRYIAYAYESPAEWDYMEGAILVREKERMQVDLRRAEQNLYTHYVNELTPVNSIRWSYRADGESDYRTLEVNDEPQWVETGTIAVTVRFVCGQFYTSDFEADVVTVNGERLEVSGKKVLENGQIVIIRGGVKYNIFGLKL